MIKRVSTTRETPSGRNTQFQDNYTGTSMTLNTFVRKIENGYYDNYHIRLINGIKTPCSNPDRSSRNNLD